MWILFLSDVATLPETDKTRGTSRDLSERESLIYEAREERYFFV